MDNLIHNHFLGNIKRFFCPHMVWWLRLLFSFILCNSHTNEIQGIWSNFGLLYTRDLFSILKHCNESNLIKSHLFLFINPFIKTFHSKLNIDAFRRFDLFSWTCDFENFQKIFRNFSKVNASLNSFLFINKAKCPNIHYLFNPNVMTYLMKIEF